jgi:hypothetical protein
MKKVKAIKDFYYNKMMVKEGDIIEVENNDAHRLIDGEYAVLPLTLVEFKEKMITPSKRKGYKIK